ncbi:VHS domain-containing protein [Lipomyces oligophaga]|uniref:VHS domain-containing protein n=1 Tax=Lipomyces oligophaga TaxID=45792 RepID=UPI0034CE615A
MSFSRYSDSIGGPPSRSESYTERFRVRDPLTSSSGMGSTSSRSDVPERSRLSRLIERACDPSNLEPNLGLNLEIADLINEKKGSSAREAATQIVKLVNSRMSAVSILALALLDICVKNCGYPFHLQISRKEFLNEFVRKFPERPPPRTSRTQALILEAIEEWKETICKTSRYKEDLGFIRDMHRLLSYKGYTFPTVNRDDAAVLNPTDNIKSAEELEEEERDAQEAKLQELIRRGTPADLLEANQLMKVLAGYDPDHRTDYRAKVAEDLAKIQRKAKLLDEMLDGVKNGDAIGRQDAFEELYNALKNAQPKIQKIIKDEGDDEEAVNKMLALNDYLNSIVERYDLIKSSKRSTPSNSEQSSRAGTPMAASRTTTTAVAPPSASLIDFDDDLPASSTQPIFLSPTPVPFTNNSAPTAANQSPSGFSPPVTTTATPSPVPQQTSSTGTNPLLASIMAQYNAPTSSQYSQPTPTIGFSSAGPSLAALLDSSNVQPVPSNQPSQVQPFPQFQRSQIDSSSLMQGFVPITVPTPPVPTSTTVSLNGTSEVSQQPSPGLPVTTSIAAEPQVSLQQQKPQQQQKNTSSNLIDLEGLF